MKKKLLVLSATIAMVMVGSVMAHKEAVDEEELAQKVVNNGAE